jgi:hypothetical protein
MAITKNDLVLLLTDIQNTKGVDLSTDITSVLKSNSIPLDVLKTIHSHRPLDISTFYEKLRSSYNQGRSKLYINIMKSDENVIKEPKTVLTTLSALLNQILQYEVEDRSMFYEHARANEIVKVLDIYFKTYNINPAFKLLELTKADIKCLEMLK